MILPVPLRKLGSRAKLLLLGLFLLIPATTFAAEKEKPVYRNYELVRGPASAPANPDLTLDDLAGANAGCASCHTDSDAKTMHDSEAVVLTCVDCHGGNAAIKGDANLPHNDARYVQARNAAHVLPKYPASWHWPSSANPKQSYTILNKESPEYVRFVNPSDYRVARESCGRCHMEVIEAAERSIMATGAMLWGGAAYNNGIIPYKNYAFGEAYTRDGQPAKLVSPGSEGMEPGKLSDKDKNRGAIAEMYPLPSWHVVPPGDIFRVFERGGRNILTQFPEIGLPNIGGIIQRLEEPGRPDLKQSNRGPGTGLRVSIPILNIHKTRLNDPFMWFMGTNDQPGDYRNSGCAGCHVVYANDREPRHSLRYAQYGRDGTTVTRDPTINRKEQCRDPSEAEERAHHLTLAAYDKKHVTDVKKEEKKRAAAKGYEPDYSDHSPCPGDDKGHGEKRDGEPHASAGHGGEAYGTDKSGKAPFGGAPAGGGHGAVKAGGNPERGHPLKHVFSKAIPTAQCMNCHMHQPNIFLNSYLGYTMWDYESDAPAMWPARQKYPTADEAFETLMRNPEAAATRGRWSNMGFLRNVYDLNKDLKDTQFADYHGHGWNFRGIFKRDREGNLLDEQGNQATYGTEGRAPDGKNHIVDPKDPEKWRKRCESFLPLWPKKHQLCLDNDADKDGVVDKFAPAGLNPGKAVHMMDIHAEAGLQCADCHFAQDSHGNGYIYGEVANAVEIGCKDCHGTADAYPTLLTSNVAARPNGTNLALLRNDDGRRRFEWYYDSSGNRVLIQRSIVNNDLEWRVSLVKDSVDMANKDRLDENGVPIFNAKAARAKLAGRIGDKTDAPGFGPGIARGDRAHDDDSMTCFTCHLSWTTSCGGCHLPIEANWKTKSHKYDGIETRNFATYNPQVARDDMFQLGRHQTTKPSGGWNADGTRTSADGSPKVGIIAPVRSTSALVLSSTNINRERIYVQQPPISAAGFSSQAFAPHFPHTVRKNETKTCTDCHLSAADDNNAIMSQLLLLGTNFVNFVGLHAWTGLETGFEAVRVTEWDEPQAVIGSYLQRYAYPDWYKAHVDANGRELKNWIRGKTFDERLSGESQALEEFANVVQGTPDRVGCLQLRGEYMFVAQGKGGFRVYDVASIGNKGFSERIITAPFAAAGHDTHVDTRNATCMALATTQPISMKRNKDSVTLFKENEEQPFDPIYGYAFITDSEEGLILVDIDTMADGEFRNNFLKRSLTWNENGLLDGAKHITLGGRYAYIAADAGMVILNLRDPLKPIHVATIPIRDARASALQFRYLWVTGADGLQLVDVTGLSAAPDHCTAASPCAPDQWTAPRLIAEATLPLADARRVYIARTYAYVAAGAEGLVIVDITKPTAPRRYGYALENAPAGWTPDAQDVIVGSTNASLFAYLADGRNGLKVIQLTSPGTQPNFYGFSPRPVPQLIAWAKTPSRAMALSKGLDRDRAVDETGGQMAVFGRLGSRPFTRVEMEKLFLNRNRIPYKVSDTPDLKDWVPAGASMAAVAN